MKKFFSISNSQGRNLFSSLANFSYELMIKLESITSCAVFGRWVKISFQIFDIMIETSSNMITSENFIINYNFGYSTVGGSSDRSEVFESDRRIFRNYGAKF